MTVSTGTMPAREVHTEADVHALCASLLQFAPELPERAQGLADAVDRYVEGAEALLAEGRRAEVPRDLAQVPLVMIPAGVRRHV